MTSRRQRLLTLTVAAAAVAATVSTGLAPAPTAAPVLEDGERRPVAAAHRDDMTVPPVRTGVTRQKPRPVERSHPRLREPIALHIPDMGVESEIVRTGMDQARNVVVPEDVLVTGWFDGSRRLDARHGSTVIVGHRDSAVQGSGALDRIEEVPVGADIEIIAADGEEHEFTVESVELIDKSELPDEAARVFSRHGPYRLVLITCGGAFDSDAGSYLSNVVVTATPEEEPLVTP